MEGMLFFPLQNLVVKVVWREDAGKDVSLLAVNRENERACSHSSITTHSVKQFCENLHHDNNQTNKEACGSSSTSKSGGFFATTKTKEESRRRQKEGDSAKESGCS
jgi:hypothetical protein